MVIMRLHQQTRTMWCRGFSPKLRPQFFSRSVASAPATKVDENKWNNALPFEAIPGPKPLPFIPKVGNVWRFLPFGTFGNRLFKDIVVELYEQYGPVVSLTGAGMMDMVFIYDPKDAEQLFRNEGQWPIRKELKSFDHYRRYTRREVFGDYLGVATTQGEEWGKMRTAINQPMMQPRNIKQYAKPIDEVADIFIERIRGIRNDELEMPSDFKNELNKWALESIVLIALDSRLGGLDKVPAADAQKMIDAVLDIFTGSFHLDLRPSLWYMTNISTPTWRRFIKSMDIIVDLSMANINKKLKQLESENEKTGNSSQGSILEILLRQKDGKQKAITMAMDMMVAGIDTTAGTTSIALYYISQNQEIQNKLFDELKQVLEHKNSEMPDDFTNRIPYLKACIKESQRMMPLASGNLRSTVKELVLGNYRIPPGTHVMIPHSALCRQEQHFKRPNEFIPERWLKDETSELSYKHTHPFVFLPFGFGPRMCVGRRLAELEMQTLLTKILRNFKVSYNYEMEWKHDLLLTPKSPLRFKMEDRDH